MSASWDGFVCPSGRSVLAGGSGSSAAYASHDALRDAGVLLCFFGQFDLWSFQQRTTKSVGRQGAGWQALANGAANIISCGPVTVTIAVDHMSLAAIEEGLGTCWIGAFTEDQVKRILGIPENIRVVAMLALGYPAVATAARPRKKLVEIVAYDGWRSWPPGVPVSFLGGSV